MCVFFSISLRKRGEILCFCVYSHRFAAFMQKFRVFHSVFAEISLHGNDNGEFQVHFVAEQTTQNGYRGAKKSASRNIPPPPG